MEHNLNRIIAKDISSAVVKNYINKNLSFEKRVSDAIITDMEGHIIELMRHCSRADAYQSGGGNVQCFRLLEFFIYIYNNFSEYSSYLMSVIRNGDSVTVQWSSDLNEHVIGNELKIVFSHDSKEPFAMQLMTKNVNIQAHQYNKDG